MSDNPVIVGRARSNRVTSIGSAPSLQAHTRIVFEPNWISFRSSVANVDRREDRGEQVETCRSCGCEVDIVPAPHSPRCPVVAARAWSRPEVEAALTVWADEHEGLPPIVADWHTSSGEHPSAKEVKALYGRWNVAIEAAGFAPSVPGRRRGKERLNAVDEPPVDELVEALDA